MPSTTSDPVVARDEIPRFLVEAMRDPFPEYRAWREHAPVCRTPAGFVLTSYAAIDAVMRDDRFIQGGGRHLDRGWERSREAWSRWIIATNPPLHTELRRTMNPPFQPKGVRRLTERVEALVAELLDRLDGRPAFDFVAEVAHPLPMQVICELLGVPEPDRETVGAAAARMAPILGSGEPPEEYVAPGNEASELLLDYFADLCRRRRADPQDDLLSYLIATDLDDDTIVANCQIMFFAGHETTTSLLGSGLLTLLRHPDQLALLREDPDRVGGAVEELLRVCAPVALSQRRAGEDVEVLGVPIPAGSRCLLVIAAGNRDPDRFPDPDRVDILRADNVPHAGSNISFGTGRHFCLGAHLARLEASVTFRRVLERWPSIALADGFEPRWLPSPVFRGLVELPIEVA